MKRRSFTGGALGLVGGLVGVECSHAMTARELAADVVIIGGSLGGCAAALAALERGLRVILTEETDWIGGQLTSQGVPPDEHPWIESHGASKSYRKLREDIRAYYRNHYQLTEESRQVLHFNPGNGSVSRLCAEPRVALAVIQAALAPYQSSGQLIVLLGCVGIAADLDGDLVKHVTVRHLLHGNQRVLSAPHFVDGTELGDLISITKTEHVTGAEGRAAGLQRLGGGRTDCGQVRRVRRRDPPPPDVQGGERA